MAAEYGSLNPSAEKPYGVHLNRGNVNGQRGGEKRALAASRLTPGNGSIQSRTPAPAKDRSGDWFDAMGESTYAPIRICGRAVNSRHFWVFVFAACLISLATIERFTFKLMVDRMEPFRYVLAQAVVLLYITLVVGVVAFKWRRGQISPEMHDFPKGKILVMAFLDLIQLYMMMVAASKVPATLTSLLLQTMVPMNMIVSVLARRRRAYSMKHLLGACLITLAMAAALYPPVSRMFGGGTQQIQSQTQRGGGQSQSQYHYSGGDDQHAADVAAGWNTLMYASSCIPAAISSVYKEHSLMAYAQPLDHHYLNMWLAVFQLALVMLTAPLGYHLQGLGYGWDRYSSEQMVHSIRGGWKCIMLMRASDNSGPDDDSEPDDCECQGALLIVLAYVASAMLMNVCVEKIMRHTRARTLYSVITSSVVVAFGVLGVYALYEAQSWHESLNVFSVTSLALVVIGLEVYHSEEEPDSEMLTQYSPAMSEAYQRHDAYG